MLVKDVDMYNDFGWWTGSTHNLQALIKENTCVFFTITYALMYMHALIQTLTYTHTNKHNADTHSRTHTHTGTYTHALYTYTHT